MNWGSKEECYCPSTVWVGKIFFDLGAIRKKYSIRCQISRSKTRYIVFQQKLLFNLVKDLFKWTWGSKEEFTVRVQSEGKRIFDLGAIRKKYSIRCQISRSKTRYIVFQHKVVFNIVKDLFKWLEGLRRSFTVRVQSEGERIFDLGAIRKKHSIKCQIWRSKTRYIVFQHKVVFNLVKDLFKWLEGLRRSVTVRVQSEGERIFDLSAIRKKYSIRCQIWRSKTRYIVFQHKLLFNLVKDLFKWIEGVRRSVTVRVQSEWENFFWPRCYTKKVLYTLSNFALAIRKKHSIKCQIWRSKTRYIVFQHKVVFNLVKDLFKWLEGLRRSVTVRVQSEGERIFDLSAIRKKYSIRCQIWRSKTRYIVFQHKLLFNLVKDLFKWIEGVRRSVTVRVQSEWEKFFWPRCYTKKVLYTLSNFALKNSLYSVSTKIAFQPSQGLIQMNWGSKEECHCPSTVWGEKNFWPRCYTKKVLYTLSNFALKNSLYSFST